MTHNVHGSDPGPLIGTGRAADVSDLGGQRVLRRNRDGTSTAVEAAVMRHARSHGFPVPEVFDTTGADLVMERITGPTMLEAFAARPWKVRQFAATLAELHTRLAAIPMPNLDLPSVWGRRETLVHGDLHPDNVMYGANGPLVIDWSNVRCDPLGSEVANTWLIVASSEIDGGLATRSVGRAGRSLFLKLFLARCDTESARTLLSAAADHRLTDPNLRPSETAAIQAIVKAEARD